MPPTERISETSQLVSPGNTAKPNCIHIVNNLCALLFTGIITYCSLKNGVSLFSFHPILMTIGWLVIMTSAINAITPGDVATEWMPIRLRSARHWVLQLLAGISIIIGFIVILTNKIINNKEHFVTVHAKFGLASVILMFVTGFGGLGALYSLSLKDYIAPIYTKIIHASVGIVTLCLGITTIVLGIYSHWWQFGELVRYISLISVLLAMALTILRPTLKVYFRLQEKISGSN